jgi:hypothetical protein
MTEFDANLDLARRADAARQCGCSAEPDDLAPARGIVLGIVMGAPLWLLAFTAGYFLVEWFKAVGW